MKITRYTDGRIEFDVSTAAETSSAMAALGIPQPPAPAAPSPPCATQTRAPARPPGRPPPSSVARKPGSTPTRAIEALRLEPKHVFDNASLAAKLDISDPKDIRNLASTLNRLSHEDGSEVECVSRGHYRYRQSAGTQENMT